MPVLALIVAFFIVVSGIGYSWRVATVEQMKNSELVARSKSMLLYRGLVADYLVNHSMFTGALSDSDLVIPSWYMSQGIQAYIESGVTYVYIVQPPSGLVGELASVVEAIGVGTNDNGFLYSPTYGNTGIAIPAVVPLGAAVIIQ